MYVIPDLSEFFQNPRTVLVSSPSEPALHLSTGPAAFFAQAINICLIRDEREQKSRLRYIVDDLLLEKKHFDFSITVYAL